jgi:hypothetical protein
MGARTRGLAKGQAPARDLVSALIWDHGPYGYVWISMHNRAIQCPLYETASYKFLPRIGNAGTDVLGWISIWVIHWISMGIR